MHTAELVELMMDLVEDEGLVVVGSVVLHYVVHWGEGRLSIRKTQDCKPLQTLSPSSLLSARVTHRWYEHAGQARRHTCIRDQEVHHFNSVKVDHHTATIGGRRDKDVTRALESGEFS